MSTNTNAKQLVDLPTETLEHILSYTTVFDAYKIVRMYLNMYPFMNIADMKDTLNGNSYKLLTVTINRILPYNYLSEYFPDPKELIRKMLVYHVALSGSSAAHHMVPGSAESSSDWDFYISANNSNIVGIMKYFESIGTKWTTAIEGLVSKLESDRDTEYIDYAHVTSLHGLVYKDVIDPQFEDLVTRLYHLPMSQYNTDPEDSEYFTTAINSKGASKRLYVVESVYQSLNIVNGVLTYRGTTQRIQLIVMNSESTLYDCQPDFMLKFDATTTQCAITGFGMYHLYGRDTNNMEASIWESSMNRDTFNPNGKTKWIEKYTSRGYKMHIGSLLHSRYPPMTRYDHTRIMSDAHSFILGYESLDESIEIDSLSLKVLSEIKYFIASQYQWKEYNDRLVSYKTVEETITPIIHKLRHSLENATYSDTEFEIVDKVFHNLRHIDDNATYNLSDLLPHIISGHDSDENNNESDKTYLVDYLADLTIL